MGNSISYVLCTLARTNLLSPQLKALAADYSRPAVEVALGTKKPFPEGEQAIAQNFDTASWYLEYCLGVKLPLSWEDHKALVNQWRRNHGWGS